MDVKLEVFVASPSDVTDERAVIGEVVATVAAEDFIRRHASLRAFLYERTVPPLFAIGQQDASGGGAQSVVNLFMNPATCDILVCLLGDRLGTELDGTDYKSGTEFELLTAHQSDRRPKPQILLYLRSPSPNANPIERKRVDDFIASLPGRGLDGFRTSFKDKAELRDRFPKDLRDVVLRLIEQQELEQELRKRKRLLGMAALILALISVAGVAYAGTTWAARRRAAAREAQVVLDAQAKERQSAEREAQAVLAMAQASDGWKEVRERLPSLGCAAVAPLTAALAATENGRPQATEAIVGALEDLAKQEPGCACPPLLAVLSVDGVAGAAGRPYCASVHREVLEAMGRLRSCTQAGPVLCRYVGKIEGGITCVQDREVDRGDSAARAKKALAARNEADTCATK